MATDYLHLFNKALADEILSMDRESLARFVDLNYAKARDSLLVFWKEKEQCSTLETIDTLIARGRDLEEMKRQLAMEIAFETDAEGRKKTIYLDYWGCFAEAFRDGIPENMIGSANYLDYWELNEDPFGEGEKLDRFYLLNSQDVDQIVKSLYRHEHELRIMDVEDIRRVENWRDFCIANPTYMVAYMNDW